MSTALISHTDCVLHEISPDHPESPQRVDAIADQLKKQDVYDYLMHADAPKATWEQLLLGHSEAYVDLIHRKAPSSGSIDLDDDTSMNVHTLDAGLRAAGGGIHAVDQVMSGTVNNAFCLTRPPGHHAERIQAMGFCIFGNIAIAARHAIRKYGLERVAIVDFDVHHGNGTEDIVDGDPNILFCSSFQYPFYPGGYRDNVENQRVNTPLKSGCNSADFRGAITKSWLPALEAYKPEMIFISAGFDAHLEDPMANVCLLDHDYVWITNKLMDIADRHSNGRIVSMLEGGYSLPTLSRCASAHVRGLMGL